MLTVASPVCWELAVLSLHIFIHLLGTYFAGGLRESVAWLEAAQPGRRWEHKSLSLVTPPSPTGAMLDNECVFFLRFFCQDLPAVP